MKEFLLPLKVFVVGMVGLLIVSIFLPSVDTSVVDLAANTSAIASHYWGWSWLMTSGVVRWVYWIGGFMLVSFAAGKAFWNQKKAMY